MSPWLAYAGVVLYAAIGLFVAVLFARYYAHTDPDGSPAQSGGAALMAGAIWPLVALIFAGYHGSRLFYRLANR